MGTIEYVVEEGIEGKEDKSSKDKAGIFWAKERPIHDPNQITDPKQLVPGARYREMRNVNGKVIEGSLLFFQRLKDDKWFKAWMIWNNEPHLQDVSLADRGIIPYDTPDGNWNKTNYLIPCD